MFDSVSSRQEKKGSGWHYALRHIASLRATTQLARITLKTVCYEFWSMGNVSIKKGLDIIADI